MRVRFSPLFGTSVLTCLVATAFAGPPQDDRFTARQVRARVLAHGTFSHAAAAPLTAAAAANVTAPNGGHINHWVVFDVPQAGPIGTYPAFINDLGQVSGNYNDATPDQLQHGFIRNPDGTILSFDPPGSQCTNPNAMNNFGTTVGYYIDVPCQDEGGTEHAFVCSAKGHCKTIDPPGAVGIASAWGINDAGEIVGHYYDASGNDYAFLRRADGTYVNIEPPANTYYINCVDITLKGEMGCGYIDGTNYTWHGLLRNPDGTLIPYDAPHAGVGPFEFGTFLAFAESLTAAGEIAGTYADQNTGYHGYIRHANGRFTEFNVAGAGTDSANGTYVGGMNFWDVVSGYWFDANGNLSSYVRFANGAIQAFQAPAPNDQGTLAGGINIWNQFTGFGFDANGTAHGFIAQAVP